MIQEYRKASAEKLRLDVHPFHYFYPEAEISPDEFLYYRNEAGGLPMWIPDEMADQMLMVWEWLNNQGFDIDIDIDRNGSIFGIWHPIKKIEFDGMDKDIKLATMKAFMEYIKQK